MAGCYIAAELAKKLRMMEWLITWLYSTSKGDECESDDAYLEWHG
jgi:hypothetical protein